MRKAQSITGALGMLFIIAVLNIQTAQAQTTLFNIPATDVVPQKKIYIENDFISHLEKAQDGGFKTYQFRTVVGLGKGLEIGANVPFTDVGALETVEVQPNIKWQFYSKEETGIAAAVGGMLFVPVKERGAFNNDNFGMLYSVVSKKVKGDYGPRFTGGAYGLVGRSDGTGTKGGAIAGYEQPLHRKVSFVTDWFSGKNRFGYVTPGLSFALPKNSYLWAGYNIGNQGRKNNSLFIYYGITF